MIRSARAVSALGSVCTVHPVKTSRPCCTDNLTDVSPRDKPWDIHKAQADAIALIYGQAGEEFFRYAVRVRTCAGCLTFQWTQPDEHGGVRLKLWGANFCRCRHCPICQWRRSLMHKARFIERLPAIQAAHKNCRLIFLTLTIKNCPLDQLKATVKHMNSSFAKLVKWETWPALGWIKAVEVTRAENGDAHPHFHCLLMVPPGYFGGRAYVTQAEWTARWQKAAKLDYTPTVDVRAIKPGTERESAAELLKYATKPSDLIQGGDWLLEYTRQTHHVRFIETGGVLRGILSDEEADSADLIHVNELPDGEKTDETAPKLTFDWNRPVKKYQRRTESAET